MNYCSIHEAWGQENYISKEYKKYDQKIENFKEIQNSNLQKPTCQKNPVIQKKTIENFSKVNVKNKHTKHTKHNKHNNKHMKCNDFIIHLKSCRSCQIKVRDQFRPKIFDNVEDIIQTNRDIIVLVIVGICIMLFFNLINSTTKDK